VKSNATTVDEYPANLPDDRREVLEVIGDAIVAMPMARAESALRQ